MIMTPRKKLNEDGSTSVKPRNNDDPMLVKQITASHSYELSLLLHGHPLEHPEKVVVPEEMATYVISSY